ncbi:hypothetical protein [Micromonospora sp. NPDC126480]|uniref:hypothetical protein n=1 Tax=Micromonospora sp. NPDC126480 TaxID=3155312 RepID=UPI003321B82F
MTATSPPADNGRRSSWRARWAERENDRRRHAHAGHAEAWRRRADELTRLRVEATGLLGAGPPTPAVPVKLRHGEVVHRVIPIAELVEVDTREGAGLPAPGLAVDPAGTDAPARPLPRGIRAVDTGRVVVTDRRVAFLGRRRQRIWWYEDLVGPAHHRHAPVTLLPTNDGSPLAGLLVSRPATLTFRFHVTLAFADGLGNRDAVAACLDELVAAHQRIRPAAPPVAVPDQAPPAARLQDRRFAGAAVALAASLVAVTAVTTGPALYSATPVGRPSRVVVADGSSGGTPGAGVAPAVTPPRPVRPAATPARRATPSAIGRPVPGAPATVAAEASASEVVPQPVPSLSSIVLPVGFCGAPPNPYGYTYCGGLLIHDPAADVCGWFRCVADFDRGRGFLVQCVDGRIGWVGGPAGTCAQDRGPKRPVYRPLVS